MNFFDILTGKREFAPGEIASEIALLEQKVPLVNEDLQKIEKEAIKIHQRKIAGVAPTGNDSKTEAEYESKKLDLKAIEASLQELREKLLEAIGKKREKIAAELTKARAEKDAELERIKKQLFNAIVDLQSLINLLQGSQLTGDLVSLAEPYITNQEDRSWLHEETKKRSILLYRNSIFEKVEELITRQRSAENSSPDEEADILINEARLKVSEK